MLLNKGYIIKIQERKKSVGQGACRKQINCPALYHNICPVQTPWKLLWIINHYCRVVLLVRSTSATLYFPVAGGGEDFVLPGVGTG
jgi:hypothetical protein